MGLSMSVFGILIALLGIGIDMTLTFLALAVLTASTGLIPTFTLVESSSELAMKMHARQRRCRVL
jgi:hypothetical protein